MARILRPPPASAPPLPPDLRLMNVVSAVAFALAAAGAGVAGWSWLMRSPLLPIRAIQLDGELLRTSVPTIRANAGPRLAGNFFSVDLDGARAAFETVPWVRRAVVRRVWPDRLLVRLEEHHAAALWQGEDGAERLVNSHGEVFDANLGEVEEEALPVLAGPDGSAAAMLSMLQQVQPALARLGLGVMRLRLSGRGSWRVELDSGAEIELGRGSQAELLARTERFVRTLQPATGRWQAPLAYADLRHRDGYAVRLRGVSTTPAAPAAARNN